MEESCRQRGLAGRILPSSTGRTRNLTSELLVRQGIPYRVVGGTRFYERAEIKVLAYLQVISNLTTRLHDGSSTLLVVESVPRRRPTIASDRIGFDGCGRRDCWILEAVLGEKQGRNKPDFIGTSQEEKLRDT